MTRHQAFTLVELLCVMAIIGILVGLLLSPVGRVLSRARGFKAEMESPAHVERLTDGMRRFASSHPRWECPDLKSFLAMAQPGGPTERWLKAHLIRFSPCQHDSPPEQVILTIDVPTSTQKSVTRYSLTQRELTTRPE